MGEILISDNGPFFTWAICSILFIDSFHYFGTVLMNSGRKWQEESRTGCNSTPHRGFSAVRCSRQGSCWIQCLPGSPRRAGRFPGTSWEGRSCEGENAPPHQRQLGRSAEVLTAGQKSAPPPRALKALVILNEGEKHVTISGMIAVWPSEVSDYFKNLGMRTHL